jgi:hypothetical protein
VHGGLRHETFSQKETISMSILGKLGGRKFLMAVFGVLAIGLHNWLNIDTHAVITLGGVIAAFIFGQGLADGLSGGVTSTTSKP